jgi:hypothetical protein
MDDKVRVQSHTPIFNEASPAWAPYNTHSNVCLLQLSRPRSNVSQLTLQSTSVACVCARAYVSALACTAHKSTDEYCPTSGTHLRAHAGRVGGEERLRMEERPPGHDMAAGVGADRTVKVWVSDALLLHLHHCCFDLTAGAYEWLQTRSSLFYMSPLRRQVSLQLKLNVAHARSACNILVTSRRSRRACGHTRMTLERKTRPRGTPKHTSRTAGNRRVLKCFAFRFAVRRFFKCATLLMIAIARYQLTRAMLLPLRATGDGH